MFRESRDRIWFVLCGFEQALRLLFILLTVFFLLTVLSVLVVDPGSDVYLIVLYNFVVFGGSLLAVFLILWRCRSRDAG